MLRRVERVRMYSVPLEDNRVRELISWYTRTLQKAIDIIWDNITWRYDLKGYRRRRYAKAKVPVIPKSAEFKRGLRSVLMEGNPYARHWVDAVIRTAYSIMDSWRKRYVKGKAKKCKPRVKRRFARCKVTLMKVDYGRKVVRITLRPREHLEVSYASAWFLDRVRGHKVGEVILKDDRVLIPFKREELHTVEDAIGWDCNELELTGFSPRIGFIHVDLRPLITARIVYQGKRSKAQKVASKRLKRGRELLEKYTHRERNKCRDIERKIAAQLVRLFPNTVHGFERLSKESMIRRDRNRSKKLRKRIARVSWRNIVREIGQRAIVKEVNPKDTSKTCSRCGFKVKDLRGQVFKCPKCGLVLDRQKNACVNIYLRMRGFPHSHEWWERSVKPLLNRELWVGVALRGRMPMIWSPMRGGLRAVKPKGLVDQVHEGLSNLNPAPGLYTCACAAHGALASSRALAAKSLALAAAASAAVSACRHWSTGQ